MFADELDCTASRILAREKRWRETMMGDNAMLEDDYGEDADANSVCRDKAPDEIRGRKDQR